MHKHTNTFQCISRLRAVSCVRNRDPLPLIKQSNTQQMQMPSACNLHHASTNSRSAARSFVYLTTQRAARSQSKIDNAQYCAVHVCVRRRLTFNQTNSNLWTFSILFKIYWSILGYIYSEGICSSCIGSFFCCLRSATGGGWSEFDKCLFEFLLPAPFLSCV